MLRIVIILVGVVVGYSTYQSPPDVPGILASMQDAPLVVRASEFISSWQFLVGAAVGLASGEALRIMWAFTKSATAIATDVGGRVVQYAAIASVIGVVVYFI